MDASPPQNLYPPHRCKTIHLVRNAQGIHNVAGEEPTYQSPEFFDAELTPLGWQQVDHLREHVHSTGLSNQVELVIVSPLFRAMQTAVGAFGKEGYTDALKLRLGIAGNSNSPAKASLGFPSFIAMETCGERLGVNWCDKMRSISEYKYLFPEIDFKSIESDGDILWTTDLREPNELLSMRGRQFLNWLWTREEKEIAIVTHGDFLTHTLAGYGDDCHISVKREICQPNKGSDSSITDDYSG